MATIGNEVLTMDSNLSFDEAFKQANQQLGEGQVFNWGGREFTTDFAATSNMNFTPSSTGQGVETAVTLAPVTTQLIPTKPVGTDLIKSANVQQIGNVADKTKVGQYFSDVGQNVKNVTKVFKKGAWKAMDQSSKAGAMSTASLVLNLVPTDDNKPETYTGAEIGKDVANLALSAAMMANPLTFVQGTIGVVSTIAGGVNKIFQRKKARKEEEEAKERHRKEMVESSTSAVKKEQRLLREKSQQADLDMEAAARAEYDRRSGDEEDERQVTQLAFGGTVNPFNKGDESDFNTDFLNLEQNVEKDFKGGGMFDYSFGGMTPGPDNHKSNDIKTYTKGGKFTGITVTGGEGVVDANAMKKIYSFKKKGDTKKAGELLFSEMDTWKQQGTAKQGASIPSFSSKGQKMNPYVKNMVQNLAKDISETKRIEGFYDILRA